MNLSPERVNEAIEKGAAYLAKYLLEGGSGSEYDYVAAYAVVHSERFRDDARLASYVIDFFRKKPAGDTYSVAFRLMGLRALDAASNRRLISQCAAYLVACQSVDGLWEYGPSQVQEPFKEKGELLVIGGRPIEGHGVPVQPVTEKLPLTRDTAWRVGSGDYSCTQYAALGLKAAEESGVRIPQEVWETMVKGVADGQCADGGWHYGPGGSRGYGSMTVAGFATYLIACHYAGSTPDTNVLKRSYEWISKYFTLKENPGARGWHYYYLYGLERAGVIGDVEFFGDPGAGPRR